MRADRGREWQTLPFRMMQLHLLSLSELDRKAFATLQETVHNLNLSSTCKLKYTCLRTNITLINCQPKSTSKPFGSSNWKDLYRGYEGSLSLLPTYILFQVLLSYRGNQSINEENYQFHPWTGFLTILFRPAAKIRAYPSTPCLWSMLFIINTS